MRQELSKLTRLYRPMLSPRCPLPAETESRAKSQAPTRVECGWRQPCSLLHPSECCLLKLSQHLAAFFGFFLHMLPCLLSSLWTGAFCPWFGWRTLVSEGFCLSRNFLFGIPISATFMNFFLSRDFCVATESATRGLFILSICRSSFSLRASSS